MSAGHDHTGQGGADGYYRGYATADTSGPTGAGGTRVTVGMAIGLVLCVLLVAGVAIMNMVDVAKVLYRPGPIYNTLGETNGHPTVVVEDAETYPTGGELNFTTVTLYGGPRYPVSAWDWLLAEFDPNTDIVDEDLVYPPDMTAQQVQEQNTELMMESQDAAAVVGVRAAGVEVPEQVKVAQIIVDAPAADTLEVNDEIRSVGGTEIHNPAQVRDVLQGFEPGDEVEFVLVRDGEEITLQVPTGEDDVEAEDGSTETRTVIGVYLASDFDLPFDVTIDAGSVGGPSAGLMFSLAVYDKLTEGELTGGHVFAGTGTIDSSGTVGPISGIRQKMISSANHGVEYFLAPAGNCDDVRGNEPDGMEVVKIETFDQARDVVEAIGQGEDVDLPRC
ncbi:YlbL family protein [Ornithinicoccus hortensis]|uniref:PDZ domain-containing protein n=1 Tax=Ornithinicoccus hortensis TaxID=82346 RepID=A0A542YQ45_9MICO|nr:PDZ domain-containing protein [Ornithinicoccus hortensis]TQL50179.1 PDZ domain-containing protein [Ornithinicoccus hortensis]